MIIWITGNSGTGKTTLGKLLAQRFGAILLDGDEMRQTVSLNAGFSMEDREEHNLRVARLAKLHDSQGFHVVVTVIAPYKSTRAKIDKLITPLWIYVYRPSLAVVAEKPYEEPENYFMAINTDKMSVKEAYDNVMNILQPLMGILSQ